MLERLGDIVDVVRFASKPAYILRLDAYVHIIGLTYTRLATPLPDRLGVLWCPKCCPSCCDACCLAPPQVFIDAPNAASGTIPKDVAPFFTGPYYEWFTGEWPRHRAT